MLRRQFDTRWGHEIHKGIMWFRQMSVHGLQDFRRCVRSSHSQYFRMNTRNEITAIGILLGT